MGFELKNSVDVAVVGPEVQRVVGRRGLNYFPDRTAQRMIAAIADVRAGVANFRIGYEGESNAAQGGNPGPANQIADVQRYGVVANIAKAFSAAGLNGRKSSFFGNKEQSAAGTPAWDPRISPYANWFGDTARRTFGGLIMNTSGTSPGGFIPDDNVDSYELFALTAPNGNAIWGVKVGGADPASWSVDKPVNPTSGTATPLNFDTNSQAGGFPDPVVRARFKKSGAPDLSAITWTPAAAANSRLLGILCYDSTKPGVDVIDGSMPSRTTMEHVGNKTDKWLPGYMYSKLGLQVVFFDQGSNNWYTEQAGAQNFDASIVQMLSDIGWEIDMAHAANADGIVVPPPFGKPQIDGGAGPTYAIQERYYDALWELAKAKDCMFLDISHRRGTAWDGSWYFQNSERTHTNGREKADRGYYAAQTLLNL